MGVARGLARDWEDASRAKAVLFLARYDGSDRAVPNDNVERSDRLAFLIGVKRSRKFVRDYVGAVIALFHIAFPQGRTGEFFQPRCRHFLGKLGIAFDSIAMTVPPQRMLDRGLFDGRVLHRLAQRQVANLRL